MGVSRDVKVRSYTKYYPVPPHKYYPRLDFRRSLVSGLPFPEQRLVIEFSTTPVMI